MTTPQAPAADLARAMRAPLEFVMGHASALDDGTLGPLAPSQRRAAKHVLDGVVRAQLLAADMIAAADLAAGVLVPRPQPLDYDDVVRQTLEAFQPLADARELTLERRTEVPGAPAIDVAVVPHVLTNLVYNAIKRAPRGGTVAVRVHDRDGWLVTEVHDGGPALATDDLLAVGAGFGQADVGGGRDGAGAGVGLGVAGALVEALGGELSVLDGRTFFFALPPARG